MTVILDFCQQNRCLDSIAVTGRPLRRDRRPSRTTKPRSASQHHHPERLAHLAGQGQAFDFLGEPIARLRLASRARSATPPQIDEVVAGDVARQIARHGVHGTHEVCCRGAVAGPPPQQQRGDLRFARSQPAVPDRPRGCTTVARFPHRTPAPRRVSAPPPAPVARGGARRPSRSGSRSPPASACRRTCRGYSGAPGRRG